MRRIATTTGLALLLAGYSAGQTLELRDKLAGSWRAQNGDRVWTLEQLDGEMRVKNTVENRTVLDVRCNTSGKECESKDSGKTAKLSMWFNGPKLVVMEVRGSDVSKRRFEVSPDGTVLNIETISISPPAKTETAKYQRTEIAAERH